MEKLKKEKESVLKDVVEIKKKEQEFQVEKEKILNTRIQEPLKIEEKNEIQIKPSVSKIQQPAVGKKTTSTQKVEVSNSPTPANVEKIKPSIQVLSPNGGEELEIGKTYDITWESVGIDKVMIQVNCPDMLAGGLTIAENVSTSLKKFSFTVSNKFRPGNNYKIEICDEKTIGINIIPCDESNNYFSIVAIP